MKTIEWQPIETLDTTTESFDLYGWIAYDCIETRLTDCDYVNGKFRYFQAGEMLDIDTIGFTPTHWMVVQPPEEREE